MKTSDLVECYAQSIGSSRSQARENIDRLVDIILTEIESGGEVTLPRLGIIHIKTRKGSIGRNPKTGETVTYTDRYKPAIRPSKKFVDALNGKI